MSEIAYQSSRVSKSLLGIFSAPKTDKKTSTADLELLVNLEKVKKELDYVHGCLDIVTDELLIDSYIYEIKSLHMRYNYYTQMCKNNGIKVDFY